MRTFLLIALLLFVAGGAYVLMNVEKVEEPVLGDEPDPGTVVCPLCNGEGLIVEVYRKAHAEESETRYQCPLCYGRGKRVVELASNESICPSCYGMGYIAYLDKEHTTRRHNVASVPPPGGKYGGGDGKFLKRPCGRCRRTGIIVPKRT